MCPSSIAYTRNANTENWQNEILFVLVSLPVMWKVKVQGHQCSIREGYRPRSTQKIFLVLQPQENYLLYMYLYSIMVLTRRIFLEEKERSRLQKLSNILYLLFVIFIRYCLCVVKMIKVENNPEY